MWGMGKKTNEMFTKEEIQTAKQVRKEIIEQDNSTLKAVYMAGEVVMHDEMCIDLRRIFELGNPITESDKNIWINKAREIVAKIIN